MTLSSGMPRPMAMPTTLIEEIAAASGSTMQLFRIGGGLVVHIFGLAGKPWADLGDCFRTVTPVA